MVDSLVFFGTGPVALESLIALEKKFKVESVVTRPDPKSSRAPRLVSDYAREHGLKLYQPKDKKTLSEEFLKIKLESKLGVVVDYGIIIAQDVIDAFELGIINSHFSILPQWRGADPITFSLLSGQETTGVSLMKINAQLDEGQLLAQSFYDIPADENINSLTTNLTDLSSQMLIEILPDYSEDKIKLFDQDTESDEPTYSRKLTKQDGQIVWTKSAAQIEREVRAYLGWPASKTELFGKKVTITSAEISSAATFGKPGEARASDDRSSIQITCGEGVLKVTSLKPDGKKEMDARSFINGYGV